MFDEEEIYNIESKIADFNIKFIKPSISDCYVEVNLNENMINFCEELKE